MSYVVRQVLQDAQRVLAEAGIDSAAVEGRLIAAHVLGVDVARVGFTDALTAEQQERVTALVSERATRVPLQYLLGTVAFGPVELSVGPGVFIPRPETELILDWAACHFGKHHGPLRAVDLCSGSGALAIGVAAMTPADVTAVEMDRDAMIWLQRNVSAQSSEISSRIHLRQADVRNHGELADLQADFIVANPPYVPAAARVSTEVAGFDPPQAVFGGDDGMSVITPMISVIAQLLLDDGRCAIEHDDTTAAAVVEELRQDGRFIDIVAHRDYADRPRFVTARRKAR